MGSQRVFKAPVRPGGEGTQSFLFAVCSKNFEKRCGIVWWSQMIAWAIVRIGLVSGMAEAEDQLGIFEMTQGKVIGGLKF